MKIILLMFVALVTLGFTEIFEEFEDIATADEKLESMVFEDEKFQNRIVFQKFEDMAAANEKFKEFKNTKLYTQLEILASGNDIKIYICSSDEYIAIIANPINNMHIESEITNAIKKEFTKAFSEEFSGRCDVVLEVQEESEEGTFLDDLLKEFKDENTPKQEDENISELIAKAEKSKEEILEEVRLAELERNLEVIKAKEMLQVDESDAWFSWWYIFFIIIFAYGYRMYKKYKPIYDEY